MRDPVEERVTAIAAAQHGVVSRSQLLGEGLTSRQIQRWLGSGRLLTRHRGVYLLGHLRGPLEPLRAPEMAAVLACGPGAVVSHLNAAWLWDLVTRPPRSAPVDVTVPSSRTASRRPGIRCHRAKGLSQDQMTEVELVPVTGPVRTLCDLATIAGSRELERAVGRAERAGLVDIEALQEAVARRRGRRGARLLRATVEGSGGRTLTRSEAESRFLALVRRGGLQQPETNVPVHGFEIDFLWRDRGIAVEVDGFAYHRSRRSFASDRRRDAVLLAAGLRVMRVTWEQIVDDPFRTLATVAQALAHGCAPARDR